MAKKKATKKANGIAAFSDSQIEAELRRRNRARRKQGKRPLGDNSRKAVTLTITPSGKEIFRDAKGRIAKRPERFFVISPKTGKPYKRLPKVIVDAETLRKEVSTASRKAKKALETPKEFKQNLKKLKKLREQKQKQATAPQRRVKRNSKKFKTKAGRVATEHFYFRFNGFNDSANFRSINNLIKRIGERGNKIRVFVEAEIKFPPTVSKTQYYTVKVKGERGLYFFDAIGAYIDADQIEERLGSNDIEQWLPIISPFRIIRAKGSKRLKIQLIKIVEIKSGNM